MTNEKIYRPNVAAVIVSALYPEKKEIFVAERNDIANAWQFPQGGIDEGETSDEALFRELEEEIGTNNVEIIAQYPEWISYDFPSKVAKRMHPFTGQKQQYYLVKLNEDALINLQTQHPEFCNYKYVSVQEIDEVVARFKKPVYTKVIEYFKNEGYL